MNDSKLGLGLIWFWRVVLVGMAVVIAVVISIYIQHDDLVAGCMRNSERTTLNAQGKFLLAERVGKRGNAGDKKSSDRYKAMGNGMVATIPTASSDQLDERLYSVKLVDIPGETEKKYVLTRTARRLQREGCEGAFPTPIPWIE